MREQKKRRSVKAIGVEAKRWSQSVFFVKVVFAAILVSILLIQPICLASGSQLPGFRAPLLDNPPSPTDLGDNTSGTAPEIDPEIEELARALRYDPGLYYKFVHDYIKFEPTFGDVKGAYMTWMDRSGNAFDQASLMVALLREAADHGTEHTITNPRFVVGRIQLSGTQAIEWFDLPDDPNVADKMFARAGMYASVSGDGSITGVDLEHCWVKVTIDGNNYEFDPSFKSHTFSTGLTTYQLKSAMGYNETTFMDHAKEGATITSTSIKDLNKANVRDDLSTYTANLVDYVEDNNCVDDLFSIFGGKRIKPADECDLPPSLPYTVNSRDDEFAHMPDRYKTKLRIQHCGIDETLCSSEIYGRRLTITYNGSNQPELRLDGTLLDTGTATTIGQAYDLVLDVNHPYDADDFDQATTLKVKAGGFYFIVNGWGDTGTKILEKHRGILEQYRYDGLSDSSEAVLGESYALVGLSWLAQTSRIRSLAGPLSPRCTLVNHHALGVAGGYDAAYIDVPLACLGVTDHDDNQQDCEATFVAVAGHYSAYEHQIIRQLQDCNAVSTVKLLEMANDRSTYDKIFKADDSNWSSIKSQLNSYSQGEKDDVNDYIDDGYTVHLPEYGDLSEDDWQGIGFKALKFTESSMVAGYFINGGYNGGYAADTGDDLSPSRVFERSYNPASDSGAYSTGSTDITIGNGGLPFGLSLTRQYSSRRRLEDGPLGLGWTHNFDITVKATSDPFQAMGGDGSPIDAAAHIVSFFISYDLLNSSADDFEKGMVASLCQAWLMDHMTDNLVTIKQGGQTMQFVKQPDGSYHAPPGQQLKLTAEGDGTFLLKNSNGVFYDFDGNGRISQWSDAFGNVVDFNYTSGKLTRVSSKIGGTTESRYLSFSYSGSRISSVTDSASRSISYAYDGDGYLIEYTNPDGNDVTYDYDDVNDGQLTEIYLPTDPNNPVVTVTYDSLGRLKQQTDANDCTVDFYNADYRTEMLEPNQTDPNNVTKRFSTVSWAGFNEEGTMTLIASDQLGRKTTYEYDGEHRTTNVINPSGTSKEYTYDEYHNQIHKFSRVKYGSADPNIEANKEYDSFESGEGRWFIRRLKYSDPNGYTTIHEYDPNVGTLLKTTYPEVDPPDDTNTPIVEFTYNAYGKLETKTDVEGMVTKLEYYSAANGAGLKKTTVDYGHLNITAELTYDNVGNVATAKDPLGNVTENEYFASRLLKKTTDPCDYETSYEYYPDGKLKYVKRKISANEYVYLRAITYNNRGQKQSVRGPYPQDPNSAELQVNYTQYAYDALGRLWKVTDAEGNVTETRCWPDGKVWKVIDAEGHTAITNTYDPNGFLVKVEDAKGNATEYEYNGFNGNKKTIYADGTYTQPGYDHIRRLETTRTRAGYSFSVDYDGLHRVKTRFLPDNEINYKYDLTGKVLEISDDNAGTIKNTYDTAGRPIKVEYPDDKEVSYEYDAAGNRTKLTYPDGSYITYEYDVLNRLKKIKDDSNTVLAKYSYDVRSRRTKVEYANGTSMDYEYDVASRLLSINSQTDTNHKYAYAYDDVGNRLSMTVNDTEEHIYDYDKIYQVTDVNYPEGYEYFVDDTTFNYDDAGNRTSVIDGGTESYATNELNQYTTVCDVNYCYDDAGNLAYDGAGSYAYDAENHLVMATKIEGCGPLNQALDNFNLSFTTGGDSDWFTTTMEYYEDEQADQDSARSCHISDSNEVWLQTTVNSGGWFKFCWAVYSEQDSDYLEFYIDGVRQTRISGYVDWDLKSYNLSSGSHTLKWRYVKDGSGSEGTDCGWVDWVQHPNSEPSPPNTLANALDCGLSFTTGGDAQWSKSSMEPYYDGDCAKSGSLDDEEETWMQTTVDVNAQEQETITFYWKVSSEEDCDYLQFYIDNVFKAEISGEKDWQQKIYTLNSGSHTLKWRYVKDGSEYEGWDCGYVDWLQAPGSSPPPPGPLAEALNCDLSIDSGGVDAWYPTATAWYLDGNAARSSYISNGEESNLDTRVYVDGQETLTFYWKVSCEQNDDYLQFYVDGVLKDQISGEVGWQKKTYTVTGSGSHTLRWRYVKDNSGVAGQDRGWVDFVQWTGPIPRPDPNDWQKITYKYDVSGRRIEKSVDGYKTTYCHDGGHEIAEYDGNGNLLRKYVYGPGVDQPVCMIEVADSNAVSYYHFDGLGSVVALSDSAGDTVQTYEYSIYGQVAASDPNHPNPYLFTGRRFDRETGLYYYRARYYNPYIGRFLQTDPVGYGYIYCWNNPLGYVDPFGLEPVLDDDKPGFLYDVWLRPKGHPSIPDYSPYPYYIQWQAMSCVPTAVLNMWLTFDIPLPREHRGSDEEAMRYVEGLLEEAMGEPSGQHDWDEEGVDHFGPVANVVGCGARVIQGTPTAEAIIDYIDEGGAVMIAVDMDVFGPLYNPDGSVNPHESWHCIVIAPTPESYLGTNTIPTDATISVLDAHGAQPLTFTEQAFIDWFSTLGLVNLDTGAGRRLANEWLVCGTDSDP